MKNNGLDLCLKTGCDHKPGKLGVCSEHEQEIWIKTVETSKMNQVCENTTGV